MMKHLVSKKLDHCVKQVSLDATPLKCMPPPHCSIDAVSNRGTLKSREWKTRHQIAGVEIAGEGKVWKAKASKMCL